MTSEEDRRDIGRYHTGPSGELGIDGAARTWTDERYEGYQVTECFSFPGPIR